MLLKYHSLSLSQDLGFYKLSRCAASRSFLVFNLRARMSSSGAEVIAARLPKGKIIGRRWKILKVLGRGSFGAVYKVEDVNTNELAALKAESGDSNVLKLEAYILKRLANFPVFVEILQSGKKEFYSYVVMTLLGPSLEALIGSVGKVCTVSTQVRVGINALYAVKALHDMGFIHRDLKPANMALGAGDSDRSRLIHLFDFGLAREYVVRGENGRAKLRRPRPVVRFRGTMRYCSVNTQERGEQGRMDDLWSLLYILVEMRGQLPWAFATDPQEILHFKKNTPAEFLLENCPVQFINFHKHIDTLNYYCRPNYTLLFTLLENIRTAGFIRYSDPYDWEFEKLLSRRMRSSSEKNALPIGRTNATQSSISLPHARKAHCRKIASDDSPFPARYFATNPLGF
ncbi:unnamed protein product [Cylicocyclus nassatus]|uniref:Protein kinase domain-containing protein n=1 Tax=Cylicocyclus nassatus TaxID=53992 RepID=A0AA36GK51_CYLNA|nr:unnamed protein product [Cylicocyclus nassatus]